jgi:hypothetical protein
MQTSASPPKYGEETRARGQRTTDHNATNFSVNLVNITASGHVNKLVYFFINAESANAGFRQSFITRDCLHRNEVCGRVQGPSGCNEGSLLQNSPNICLQLPYPNPSTTVMSLGDSNKPHRRTRSAYDGSRDAGVVVWGNVADGMLKYYLGVSDGGLIGDEASTLRQRTTKDPLPTP